MPEEHSPGSAEHFLTELAREMPADARLILCGFPGDPYEADSTAWRPRPWRPGADNPFGRADNAYSTVAAFGRAPDNTWRRRTETFRAGLALMVDDVGTPGVGSARVDRERVAHMRPTFRVETSPNNEQWWYMLSEPELDAARFDGLIRAFITGRLLGADPGMSGITRVGRLPGHLNGKKAYKGFRTRVVEFTAQRWTSDELLEGFGLKIQGRAVPMRRLPTEEALERNRLFAQYYKWLDQRNMLKRHEPDLSGWTPIRCPWTENHTGGVDNGAAIREPHEENNFWGAARCHHGHCREKTWKDLTDWIDEQAVEELERANNQEQQS